MGGHFSGKNGSDTVKSVSDRGKSLVDFRLSASDITDSLNDIRLSASDIILSEVEFACFGTDSG